MKIQKYSILDNQKLFEMMVREGEEWKTYYRDKNEEYKKVLEESITYVCFENDFLCGYIRCRRDGDFGIYILDLLVDKKYRGRSIGKKLIDEILLDYPDNIIYVTSDADIYYEKQGFKKEGSILSFSQI